MKTRRTPSGLRITKDLLLITSDRRLTSFNFWKKLIFDQKLKEVNLWLEVNLWSEVKVKVKVKKLIS